MDWLTPTLIVLAAWLLGMIFGVFVGAMPGLTATMAVALLLPVSYQLGPTAGLALIIGVSFTAIFAGDIPATYLRIPGTPASAAATLDGHEMAKKGRARSALMLDLFCSAIGGLIGVLLLMTIAPQLAIFALLFSNYEYFWLAVMGLSLSALVSKGSTAKGLLSAALGMFISTIGLDVLGGAPRFTFKEIGFIRDSGLSVQLMRGLHFIPVMIGLFGLSEVLRNLRHPQRLAETSVREEDRLPLWETIVTIWRTKWTVFRSAISGTFIGALPGAGADIAAWAAYGLAKKTSKKPDEFGTGTEEGVVAPTSANNAAVAGAWIPALVFGIPGDTVTAIVLAAMMVHKIRPGRDLFENPDSPLFWILLIALATQFFLIPVGLAGIAAFRWIMRLPRSVVLTGVVILSVVGSFAFRNNLFDVWVMFVFGLLGYFLEARRVPLAPLILGLILGPMIEENLRTGLIASSGSVLPFFTRPLCLAFVVVLAAAMAGKPLYWLARRGVQPSK